MENTLQTHSSDQHETVGIHKRKLARPICTVFQRPGVICCFFFLPVNDSIIISRIIFYYSPVGSQKERDKELMSSPWGLCVLEFDTQKPTKRRQASVPFYNLSSMFWIRTALGIISVHLESKLKGKLSEILAEFYLILVPLF